jgi:hypothetical protein
VQGVQDCISSSLVMEGEVEVGHDVSACKLVLDKRSG